MMLGYTFIAIVAAAVTVFAVQNAEPTRVRFLVWSDSVPAAVLVLLSLAVGIVLTGVPLWLQRWRLRARVRTLEAQLQMLERRSGAEVPPQESTAS